ncbi:hypothetical protein PTKU64_84910 [Paraburkholderia terrae]|uniref:Uncharacterized protein n=1 Tax=Paraburkholderia terrae TaxID=311230 RepID=A0ABM7UA65_9BURK|nr:hypothetical protein [Paraburkholderia terrae]BCZ84816.1 hypothetical protein PTKU64_84910 [Paraburkholderia terrae]
MTYLKGGCLVAIGVLIGMLITGFVKWPPQQSSDWAAWMQAIGAIVGIAIAIAIPAWQQLISQRRERVVAASGFRATTQVAKIGLDLVRDAVNAVENINDAWLYFQNDFHDAHFSQVADLLSTANIHALPTQKAVISYVDARRHYGECVDRIRIFARQCLAPGDQYEYDRDMLQESFVNLASDVNALINQCTLLERGVSS